MAAIPGAGRDVQGRDGNGGLLEGDHGFTARIEPTPGDQGALSQLGPQVPPPS
jgi:hypothetical protein